MDISKEIVTKAKEINGHIDAYLATGIENKKLGDAMRHYPAAGGKRMRPILAQVVAEAIGKAGDKAIPFGCGIELIHNFTLVHDDVMDNDLMRRGIPSVHALYDVPTAIIAGDALFARAFEIVAETDVEPAKLPSLMKLAARSIFLVAEGQQDDMDFENIPAEELKEEDYMRMVWKKTAVLFECAAEGGAIIGGGSPEQIEKMKEYAHMLGIGFQIWDDVLALTGNEEILGKPVGNDIRNGKRTIIALHALHNLKADDPRKKTLLAALGNADATEEQIKAAIEAIQESIDYAKNASVECANKAKAALSCIADGPEKEFLSGLVDFAVGRSV
ncbi:polyprenyl synthetase family protein [Candidatus Methanomassiliicoccus intestinalis]|uniref:polyprenyl synthetase family protein n=2 Tax=Candidatus Methanomassiliicoccus intestinalis TaxID=1406512 RepID=UPI0037DC4B2A